MILLIDNFDSFTYNIFQYLKRMNHDVLVRRNNDISISEIKELNPSHIIISPGPGKPESAGISIDTVIHFTGKIPILGVCLGHQCIGSANKCEIVKSEKIYHGKVSEITHDGKGVFNGIPTPIQATRYHSLVIRKQTLSPDLEVTAWSEDGEIMGVRHKKFLVEGVQFHPESIGTPEGYDILSNFLEHKPEPIFIKSAIKKVHQHIDLTVEESEKVMDEITSGSASPPQIAAVLTAISLKGESISELTGFANIMRKKATPISRPVDRIVIDTCGTGGDSSGTFNISTVAALVAAGAGITVAKHGNRSITSRCGSADVLEALGVNISAPIEVLISCLDKVGISFLFAPLLHQSMKHAAPVRKEIGIRTAFNILGPLSNPAGADFQIAGVFSPDLTEKVAHVLNNLGMKRAMVVHGNDGLDEITLTHQTRISEVKDGWVRTFYFDPREYGFEYCSPADLKGGLFRIMQRRFSTSLKGKMDPGGMWWL